MRVRVLAGVAVVGAMIACESMTDTDQFYTTTDLSADVAASAGDAMATSIESMIANEAAISLAGDANLIAPPSNALDFTRTRTCYDLNDAVVAGCSPLSSVRKVVTDWSVSGSRSGSRSTEGGGTATWTGAVHASASDTLRRNFNGSSEVSRSHSGVGVAHDTSTFTNADVARLVAEAAHDTVTGLTWNLPRASNPWPAAGTIVRVDTAHATATRENRTRTVDVVRRLEVDFPADAQGNVTLKINDKTCQLNLVTHKVTSCTT